MEIASGICKGRFASENVVAESIRRAKAVRETLNPFTVLREEQALEAAREADRAAARGEATGPLHGVPFAAKDLTPTAGDLTTLGLDGQRATGCLPKQRSASAVFKTRVPF